MCFLKAMMVTLNPFIVYNVVWLENADVHQKRP